MSDKKVQDDMARGIYNKGGVSSEDNYLLT